MGLAAKGSTESSVPAGSAHTEHACVPSSHLRTEEHPGIKDSCNYTDHEEQTLQASKTSTKGIENPVCLLDSLASIFSLLFVLF